MLDDLYNAVLWQLSRLGSPLEQLDFTEQFASLENDRERLHLCQRWNRAYTRIGAADDGAWWGHTFSRGGYSL